MDRVDEGEGSKAIALKAIRGVFIERDARVVQELFAPDYIQHNPTIPNGRDAIAGLLGSLPEGVRYEPGMVAAEGSIVMIHGRYVGWAPEPMVAVDIFRVENGRLVEHWDVMQAEVPAHETKSNIGFIPWFPLEAGELTRPDGLVDRPAGLMEMARFDIGDVLSNGNSAPKSVRLVIGNPLIMKEMVKHVPDAASYAPVTVLIDERAAGVHLSYDLIASFLAAYDNAQAAAVATQRDGKVLALLTAAAQ